MSRVGSKTHEFTLTLDGVSDWTDAVMDRLFEAGCDDASFGTACGVHYAVFHREAPSFDQAVASARSAVEGAGLTVLRVDRDD